MTAYRPKVYFASKLRHAELWRLMRHNYSHLFEVTSRWIDIEDVMETERAAGPSDFRRFWITDIQDIQRSDFVLVYQQADDILKGAIAEAGAAIALGKLVLAVNLETTHTWTYHPLVIRLVDLEEAKQFFRHIQHQPRDPKNYGVRS